MQAKAVETKAQQSCGVMNCVPVNQTYIYSIQPNTTKQPNVILWSQSNVVTQNPVVTVMTTSADSSVVTIPSTAANAIPCAETSDVKTAYVNDSENDKKYSFESKYGRYVILLASFFLSLFL